MLDHLSSDLVFGMDWFRPTILRLIGLAPRWISVLIEFLLLYSALLLARTHAHLFICIPCLFCYGQCTAIKLQLGLLCCMMSPIVLLADLAVFSVGRGLEPPTPVLNLLNNGIYCVMSIHMCLKHPVEYLAIRTNTEWT